MPFGVSGENQNAINRTTRVSSNQAEKSDSKGKVVEMTTFGLKTEISETSFATTLAMPEITEGASCVDGTTPITTAASVVEANNEYTKIETTKMHPGAPKATSGS